MEACSDRRPDAAGGSGDDDGRAHRNAVLGRGFRRLATLLDAPSGNETEIAALLARIRSVGLFAVALLVATAVIMVLKPVF